MSILDDYIHEADAATDLGVTQRTMWRYRNQPDGLPYYEIGGRIYFHKEELDDWLRNNCARRPNPRVL